MRSRRPPSSPRRRPRLASTRAGWWSAGIPPVRRSPPWCASRRALNLAGLPPAIIHTAEYDPMRDEGAAYAKRLMAAGVTVEHACHEGMIHNFHAMGALLPQARLVLSQIGEQVRRIVG